MTVTTLDLSSAVGAQPYPLTINVYMRQFWTAAWTLIEDIAVDRVVWAMSPRIGIAQLYWRYGIGKLPDQLAMAQISRKDLTRWWVKLEVVSPSLTIPDTVTVRDWYGVVDLTRDRVDGDITVASGRQAFIAYSLEQLLFTYPIRHSVFGDSGDTGIHHIGLTFNGKSKGNRSAGDSPLGYPVFSEAAEGSKWTSRDIVRYVIGAYPISRSGDVEPEQRFTGNTLNTDFDPNGLQYLPSWDAPELKLHGRSPGQILNAIMARHRLLGWRIVVTASDTLRVTPYSFATEDIVLTNENRIKANPSLYHIDAYDAADTLVSVRLDSTGKYDQVIADGARRRSCFSISDADSTLVPGWTSNDEANYGLGASADAGYPAASEVDERRRLNHESRTAGEMREVYSRFQLPLLWDYEAGDGEGGLKYPAFIESPSHGFPDDFASAQDPYRPSIGFEPTLPLLSGVDYSVSMYPPVGYTGTGEELPPIVVIELPEDPGHYAPVQHAGSVADLPNTDPNSNRRWSASVRVNVRQHEKALYVRVTGQPQHVIAADDFVPLTEDRELGQFKWQTMIATVSVREDRRVTGAWPDAAAIVGKEAIRILRIHAGDTFRLDQLLAGTVVGVDRESGGLVKSTKARMLNDDRAALVNIAQVAYQWYGVERKVLELQTAKIHGELNIGDVVWSISRTAQADIDVGTVITQIVIENPLSASEAPPAATMSIVTAFAELDPLRV